jgi:hypothetical protein
MPEWPKWALCVRFVCADAVYKCKTGVNTSNGLSLWPGVWPSIWFSVLQKAGVDESNGHISIDSGLAFGTAFGVRVLRDTTSQETTEFIIITWMAAGVGLP